MIYQFYTILTTIQASESPISNQFCINIIEHLTVLPVLEHGIVIIVGLPKKLSLTCKGSGKNLTVKFNWSRRQNLSTPK